MKRYTAIAVLVLALLNLRCDRVPEVSTIPVQPPPAAPAAAPEEPAAAPEMPAVEAEAPAEAAPVIDVATLALKMDPVCKMSLEEYPAVASQEYEGKTYGFCSEHCKKKFNEDPEKILARVAAAADAAPADAAGVQ